MSAVKDRLDKDTTSAILGRAGFEIDRHYKLMLRDEKTPSAIINNNGTIHDFGSGEHYDVQQVLMDFRGLSFPEAKELVLTELGMANLPDYVPVKHSTTVSSITLNRHNEITTEINDFLTSTRQTFKDQHYLAEAISIAPYWVYKQASKEDIEDFRTVTTFDDRNNTLVVKIHDYNGRLISYKRRKVLEKDGKVTKWKSAHSTHPNKQCLKRFKDEGIVYVVEGHHDFLTAILVGLNVLMIPTVSYNKFTEYELSILQGKKVVFMPDLKKGDRKGIDTMTALAEQVGDRVNVLSLTRLLDIMNLKTRRTSLDFSDVVNLYDEGLQTLQAYLLYAGDQNIEYYGEIF